jgi:hypothetical protein
MTYWLTCLHGKSQLPLMLKVTALHSSSVLTYSTFHVWSDANWICYTVELQCSWIVMFGILTLHDHSFSCCCFDLSWSVLTNWMRPCNCQVCYCTVYCQHRQTVLCIMWGWLFSLCMNWDLLQSFNAFFALCNHWYIIKNKLSCFFFLRSFHVFITGIL